MSQRSIPQLPVEPPQTPPGNSLGGTKLIEESFDSELARRHRYGMIFEWVCWLATWGSVVILGVLIATMAWQAMGWLTPKFLVSMPRRNPADAGILPGIVGTFWLILLTAVLSVPLGVGAAIYLEEYSKPTLLTKFIQLNIANLAGVPSIVYGILGFTAFVRMFGLAKSEYLINLGIGSLQLTLPFGRTVISGALTLALLSLPVVIIASQEALRSVPPSLRHASLALGATKWQTIWHQVLPSALPGMMTGVILAMSRAIGETAPLVAIGAATYITFTPGRLNSVSEAFTRPDKLAQVPFDSFTTIPMQIYGWINEAKPEFQHVAAAAILVLLVILLISNGLAIFIRQHFQKKVRW